MHGLDKITTVEALLFLWLIINIRQSSINVNSAPNTTIVRLLSVRTSTRILAQATTVW